MSREGGKIESAIPWMCFRASCGDVFQQLHVVRAHEMPGCLQGKYFLTCSS